jgi:hypothetical protein
VRLVICSSYGRSQWDGREEERKKEREQRDLYVGVISRSGHLLCATEISFVPRYHRQVANRSQWTAIEF